MRISMVWKTRAATLTLLWMVSCIVWADSFDFSLPDDDRQVIKNVDPTDYDDLDGTWWCHFLKYKNRIERDYYSAWTFDRNKHLIDIFYSPVHKGFTYGYHWDGKQLVIRDPSPSSRQIYSTNNTRMWIGGTLVIEDPRLRWKGWRCTPQPGVRWPEDGLQFLDYTRYPWLSSLIEDGPSIMKYREPKQYQEWQKGRPR